jgi:hypothetical protein
MYTNAELDQIRDAPRPYEQWVVPGSYARVSTGKRTALIPADAELSSKGVAMANAARAAWLSGRAKMHFESWRMVSCASGHRVNVYRNERVLAIHSFDNVLIESRAPDNSGWLRTSEIVWFDPDRRFARTRSGSVYSLAPHGELPALLR